MSVWLFLCNVRSSVRQVPQPCILHLMGTGNSLQGSCKELKSSIVDSRTLIPLLRNECGHSLSPQMTMHLAVTSNSITWLLVVTFSTGNSKCVAGSCVLCHTFDLKAGPPSLVPAQPLPWITLVMARHLGTSIFSSVKPG